MRNLSAENVEKDKEPTEKVEEVPATDKSIAEEAKRDETTAKANVVSDDLEKETADQVEAIVRDLDDELCPDEIYEEQFTSISVGTQTLECGGAQTPASKSVFDFYTLADDDNDPDE